jgi:putative transposase
MPWKEHRVMSMKIEFVKRASEKGANIAGLCRELGISRQTGHKWLRRFQAHGYDGLEEQSRRPKSAPLATAEEIVAGILVLRDAHPRWGARKLVVLLRKEFGDGTPSERTVDRVLERFGKLRKRRQRQPPNLVDRAPEASAMAPNDVWTIDFKGWWRAVDGSRCEPLTVRDAYSRFILAIVLLQRTDTESVREVLKRLFKKHGVPRAIQCDNGSPFVSVRCRAGLTRLSAWWVSLGIKIVRSRVGCPQDNGAHERMHKDMAADLERTPGRSRLHQQRACDRWRQEFNHVRPHDALKGKTPSDLYRSSTRVALERTPVYPSSWLVRRVKANGEFAFEHRSYFVSMSLAGQHIGLEPVSGLRSRAWFHDIDLGEIELPIFDYAVANSLRSTTGRLAA